MDYEWLCNVSKDLSVRFRIWKQALSFQGPLSHLHSQNIHKELQQKYVLMKKNKKKKPHLIKQVRYSQEITAGLFTLVTL